MIMVASLVAIAQETGTVAEQGEMVRKRSKLCFLNGTEKVVIPEAELMQLLDEETYDSYGHGRRFFKVGTGLICGGIGVTAAGVGVAALGTHYMGTSEGNYDQKVMGSEVLVIGIGLCVYGSMMMLPAGFAFQGIGRGKISRIAEEYNENNPTTTVSYRLSPAVMPVNVPQSQGNMAYGMTFSVNFRSVSCNQPFHCRSSARHQ